MTNFLLKLFVPHFREDPDAASRSAVGTLSGGVGIVCNFALFLAKILMGSLAGSVSMMADAWNNLSDASGSIVTLAGFKLAEKPADEGHPYGHARFEYLSGLAVAAMILVIGFELAKTSVEKILSPAPVEFSTAALTVLILAVGVKLWMFRFNTRLGKAIRSTALLATAADSRNDCIATSAVLLAGLIERFSGLRVDGIVGLGVAGFILHSGIDLARETISPLLGEGANPELRQQIVDYVESRPGVLGYHDLMVHDYGPGRRFATLHVEMDYREEAIVCHELIDDMERECLRSHNVHLVIHYDPVITDDPELNRLRDRCAALLRQRDPRLTLHDFRMVQGRVHMNLIFDVPLPSDLQGQEHSIRASVEDALNGQDAMTYHVKITFDVPEI